MLSKQIKKDQSDTNLIVEAYSLFENNQNYQQKCTAFRKNIQNGDQQIMVKNSFTIWVIINAIKNILTYKVIANLQDLFKAQKNSKAFSNEESIKCINLNEFSKLLALRFLREAYFDGNYLFMTYAQLELSSILLKIGLFKKQSSDEERGRSIFNADSKIFLINNQNAAYSRKIDKQIEVIAFSIHKLTLEFLFTCGQLTHCIPFHQQYMIHEGKDQSETFNNGFYSIYEKLRQQKVKFPTKFHYFKQKDALKYSNEYMKAIFKDQIQKFYNQIFEQVWTVMHKIIGMDDFHFNNLYIYILTFADDSSTYLQQKIQFCQKLVLQTCDRFFWKYFIQFVENKLSELNNFLELDESLTEKQLKEILALHLFLLSFNYHLLQPEIMYLMEHQFIKELARLFLVVLKFYGKLSQTKESNAYKISTKSKILPLQGSLTSSQTLKCIIFCFARIKEFSIEFTHQFHEKQNVNHSYPLISLYFDIVIQIEPIAYKKIQTSQYKDKAERAIIDRMNNNHQFYFKKQSFLFSYYEKESLSKYNYKQIKLEFKKSVQKVFHRYSKYFNIVEVNEKSPLTQYINIQRELISKEDIEIVPNKNTDKIVKSRYSYRLNLMGSHRRFFSEDKGSEINSQKMPSIKSAINSPLSFVQSLKITVSKPNENLVKSLSSSRKLRHRNHVSNSHIKSYSSNQLSEYSSELSQANNALPPFNTPPQFKQVFIENCDPPIFDKSLENISTPMKKSLKRIHKINRNQEAISTRYINNFIQQKKNKTEIKNSEISSYNSSMHKNQTNHQTQIKPVPSQEIKVDTQSYNIEQKVERKLNYVRSIKQFSRQSIKLEKQSEEKSQGMQKMCFYYTPKAKKQLLKKKVLIKKHGCVQIGMIVNLQEDIVASESSTVKRYMLLIKIYISALVPIAKINVNVKFPNWLECISKANLYKENLKEQSQFISNFIVELKSYRQKIIQRNYGQLPILNVVFVDRLDKKQVISEPLYILINRFTIEKTFEEQDFQLFIQDNAIAMPFMVHERIATDLKSIKQYFSNLNVFNLEPTEKMNLFSTQELIVSDFLGIVKLQFIKNHQQLLLVFFQAIQGPQTVKVNPSGKSKLFVELHPLKKEEWNYEQLHIFQTCLRSIFCSDK